MNWMIFGATGLAAGLAAGIAHFGFGASPLLGASLVLAPLVVYDMQRTMRSANTGEAGQ